MAESYLQSFCDEEDEQHVEAPSSLTFGQEEEMGESSKLYVFQALRWFPYHLL